MIKFFAGVMGTIIIGSTMWFMNWGTPQPLIVVLPVLVLMCMVVVE